MRVIRSKVMIKGGKFSDMKQRIKDYLQLISLITDFTAVIKKYIPIIVSELSLPNAKKTVKPISGRGQSSLVIFHLTHSNLSSNSSSTDGGKKYVIRDIVFQFAEDTAPILKKDHAHKAAKKQMTNLVQLLHCTLELCIDDLFFPLISIVDYRGFRIIGMQFNHYPMRTLLE